MQAQEPYGVDHREVLRPNALSAQVNAIVRGGGKFPSTRDPDTREISSSTSHPGLGAQTLAPSGTQQVPQVSLGAVVPGDQPVDTPVHPVTVIGEMFPRALGSTRR